MKLTPALAALAATFFAAALLAVPGVGAAKPESDPVRAYVAAHEKEILGEFSQMLALPNVATKTADIERNADFLRAALQRRGFTTQLLSAGPGTPPAVFGELKTAGAKRTVVFYAHYDGQPVSQPEWRTSPFEPVVREGADAANARTVDWRAAARLDPEWRVYARSAGDDKAPIQAMLSALDALKAAGRRPTINIKVFYEGEEEQGSRNLARILEVGKPLLGGDMFLLSDGPRHQTGRMQLFFGARGVSSVDLTVYGPMRPLHDGHYGNWAPNPASMLARLLASLRDDEGHILIPGFYDDVRPLSTTERSALAALPDVESQLKSELALGRTEGKERLLESIARPALNIRGIRVGDVGERASNTIATEARAAIDFRLVPDETPEAIRQRTEDYLRAQGWFVVHTPPDAATRAAHPKVVLADWSLDYAAYRADMDSPAARAVLASVERTTGGPVLRVPMLGASTPMGTFARTLGLPIIGLPIANYDDNQHAANENLRLGNLWDGIAIYAGLLTDLGHDDRPRP